MSRGIRDLREIICVSRLCNAYQQHEAVAVDIDIADKIGTIQQSISCGKPSHKSSHSKAALPDIKTHFNIDKLINYVELIDEKLLSEWLHRANRQLHQLIGWAQDENAFVNFTNFWLLEMASSDRRELLVMEYGILVDEIRQGLLSYIKDNVDLLTYQLISISFWEYQKHFQPNSSSGRGYYLFLEYLDGLLCTAFWTTGTAAGNGEMHKYILTNVKFPTQNKQLIQVLLTIRALALVSIWTAVIDFYRNLIDRGAVQLRSVELIHQLPNHLSGEVVLYRRICVAICHQFIPTLQYWINKKKINFQEYRDEQDRNLLILAISYNSLSVVQYFLNNYDVSSIINCASKTGNSALHLAVCQGNIDIVKLLIDAGHADVNIANGDCDNCTPLHMAAMYGQQDIAQYLMEHGANQDLVTGSNSTAIDMANLYEQYEVVKLLQAGAQCPR